MVVKMSMEYDNTNKKKVPAIPIWPIIKPNLKNIKIDSTFNDVGRNTPSNVPSLAFSTTGFFFKLWRLLVFLFDDLVSIWFGFGRSVDVSVVGCRILFKSIVEISQPIKNTRGFSTLLLLSFSSVLILISPYFSRHKIALSRIW